MLYRVPHLLCAIALTIPAAAVAQSTKADVQDMACYVGLSLVGQKVQTEGKNPVAIENLKFALAFYGGKIAARHPGGNVPATIKGQHTAVQAALKAFNGQSCMTEMGKAMKDAK